MATLIKGEDLILYVYDGVSAYEPVACLTSNSLSITSNVIESQTKCDPGATIKSPGTMSYEIPFEGEYIVQESGKLGHDELLPLINTASAGTLTWRMDTGQSGTPYYYGTGILTDLELTGEAGDSISTFSGTIQGSGLIVTTDPEA